MREGEELVRWLDEQQGAERTRTPYLARLELHTRCPGGGGDATLEAVVKYFEVFGGKDVCAYDLVGYLGRVPAAAYPFLLTRLRAVGEVNTQDLEDGNSANFEKSCLREGCVAKFERLLSGLQGRKALLEAAKRYITRFNCTASKVIAEP